MISIFRTLINIIKAKRYCKKATNGYKIKGDRHFISFPIAGLYYYRNCSIISQLKSGTTLELDYEPDNIHDYRAIRISYNGHKLGYVPRRLNHIILTMMVLDKDIHAEVLAATPIDNPQTINVIVYFDNPLDGDIIFRIPKRTQL